MAPRINIPPLTRGLLIAIVAFSFLYNFARWQAANSTTSIIGTGSPAIPYLTLVPSNCLFYPWTFLTATFVERNVITLALNCAVLFWGGRYLERAWGTRTFGIFILVIAIIPNVIVVPIYLLWSGLVADSSTAVSPVSGGITVQAAFVVAFKQLVPEHTVSVFKGVVKMRVKHFPAIFLLVNTLSLLLGMATPALLAWIGLVTAWVYLRFYKRQPEISGTSTSGATLKGDASETFAFATFFPDIMQPPIAAICDQIFNILCTLKICTPFSDEAIASGNEQAAARGEASLPSLLNPGRSSRSQGKREEAERRRALALKALDQRLNDATSSRAAAAAATASVETAPTESSSDAVPFQPDNQASAQ